MEFLYAHTWRGCVVGPLTERSLPGAGDNPGLRLVASDEYRCPYVFGRVAMTGAGAIDSVCYVAGL
jgi:hypothetical protein